MPPPPPRAAAPARQPQLRAICAAITCNAGALFVHRGSQIRRGPAEIRKRAVQNPEVARSDASESGPTAHGPGSGPAVTPPASSTCSFRPRRLRNLPVASEHIQVKPESGFEWHRTSPMLPVRAAAAAGAGTSSGLLRAGLSELPARHCRSSRSLAQCRSTAAGSENAASVRSFHLALTADTMRTKCSCEQLLAKAGK